MIGQMRYLAAVRHYLRRKARRVYNFLLLLKLQDRKKMPMPTTTQWQIRMKEKAMLDKWKDNMSSAHLLNILAANVNCKKNTITCYISFEGIYNSISRIYKYIYIYLPWQNIKVFFHSAILLREDIYIYTTALWYLPWQNSRIAE